MEEFEQNTGSGRRVTKVANEHGTGSSNEVWVILGHGPVVKKLPATERGVFHRGNCYLVIWCSERDPSKRKRAKYVMIYFAASKQASERASERATVIEVNRSSALSRSFWPSVPCSQRARQLSIIAGNVQLAALQLIKAQPCDRLTRSWRCQRWIRLDTKQRP